VNVGHVVGEVGGDFFAWECNVFEELLGDTNKRILGPLMEPIDGGAVDETGERAASDSECFTDG